MNAAPSILELEHGICAVDTEYVRPHMDASHLIVEDGRAAFVDTGTNHSVPALLEALAIKNLDPGDVDYVFLTHIHLDHAGGAGLLMQQLPNASCVVHPLGAPHMAEPSKLIAGTEAVYGVELAHAMYGDIQPIDAERIIATADDQSFSLNGRPLFAFYTEGHARHHYCLDDARSAGVFTGDSFGLSYRELDTAAGPFVMATTTPTHFDPVEAHKSIDRIMACEPKRLFLTHYSEVGDLDRLAADMHADIDACAGIADRLVDTDDRTAAIEAALFDHLADRIEAHGFDGDRQAIRDIVGMDAKLNAQGLDIWLKRKSR
ncbi:MAG: MBL fold metallo-hydrolase [Pseudomonadota bacterium]